MVLLAVVIIAIMLAVIFWYITIPLIAIGIIWLYKDDIRKSLNERKKKKEFKKYTKNENGEKQWNLINEFSISNSEAELIFGNEFMLNYPTSKLYPKCVEIAHDYKKILFIPKYLILKLGDIFEKVSELYIYEVFTKNYYYISKSLDVIEQETDETKVFLKNFFENYENYRDAQRKQNNDNYEKKSSSYNSNYSGRTHGSNNYRRRRSSGKYAYIRQKRIKERLEKFHISESDAQIIFGKSWESKMGKPEWEFFYDVWRLEIKITYDYNGRYRRKFGPLLDKILEIIRIVDEENPEMASHKTEQTSDYNYEYEDDSENFNSENSVDDDQVNWALSIFNLKSNPSVDEIKKRYRELSLKYHPDRNPSNDSTMKMSEINNAYEVLCKFGATA
jgi:hypothetical protein